MTTFPGRYMFSGQRAIGSKSIIMMSFILYPLPFENIAKFNDVHHNYFSRNSGNTSKHV